MEVSNQIAHDFSPYLLVYKDGRVDRLVANDFVPPSVDDPQQAVSSRDIEILPHLGVSARLYLPKPKANDPPPPENQKKEKKEKKKLPILVYFHGGGFCIGTPFSAPYHYFLTSIVSEAQVIAVSVHYRRAPEHPLPAAYNDSWAALKWVVSHASGSGPDPWLTQYGDFDRIVLAGDSAGANITHNLLIKAGGSSSSGELGLKKKKKIIYGGVLIHPYFCGSDPVGSEIADPEKKAVGDGMWRYACPSTTNGLDLDDPRINPTRGVGAPRLSAVGCERVMVCVAERDVWRDRGIEYYEELCWRSGWDGVGEMMESKGEDHVFFLLNPWCEKAVKFRSRLAAWINFNSTD